MGDRSRFRVFAQFIRATFPDAQRIADVGGGRGELAVELTFLGYQVEVIDPRMHSNLPRRVHKRLRKEAIRTGSLPRFGRQKRTIENINLTGFDLLVGMHPDEATEPIVRLAVQKGKRFAVVPCCVMPIDGISRPFERWLDYLAELAPDSERFELSIGGRNTVIYWRGDRR